MRDVILDSCCRQPAAQMQQVSARSHATLGCVLELQHVCKSPVCPESVSGTCRCKLAATYIKIAHPEGPLSSKTRRLQDVILTQVSPGCSGALAHALISCLGVMYAHMKWSHHWGVFGRPVASSCGGATGNRRQFATGTGLALMYGHHTMWCCVCVRVFFVGMIRKGICLELADSEHTYLLLVYMMRRRSAEQVKVWSQLFGCMYPLF